MFEAKVGTFGYLVHLGIIWLFGCLCCVHLITGKGSSFSFEDIKTFTPDFL